MQGESGSNRVMRSALGYTGSQICGIERDYRKVEFTIEASLTLQLTVDRLISLTTALRDAALENQNRADAFPNADYLALINTHKAVHAYAREIFPDVTFSPLEGDLSDGPEPDAELSHIITLISQLLEGLNAIIA